MQQPNYIGDRIRWQYVSKYLLQNTTNGLLVDLGAGQGEYKELVEYKGYIYAGYDLKPNPLKPEIRFADVCDLNNIKENTFDAVLFIDVLEHIKEDKKALKEIHRILKPDCTLVLHTPNKNQKHVLTEPKEQLDHVRKGYGKTELYEMASEFFKIDTLAPTFTPVEGLLWDINYVLSNKINFNINEAFNNISSFINYGWILVCRKREFVKEIVK